MHQTQRNERKTGALVILATRSQRLFDVLLGALGALHKIERVGRIYVRRVLTKTRVANYNPVPFSDFDVRPHGCRRPFNEG